MASTIKLKNGSGAPLAGDLVQGEPALDLTNKRLYTEDSGGTVIEVGINPSSLTTSSADINGGTIDGTVIGGSSAAAGTFTTFTSTGIDDNATSTAITIDASENVGIGNSTPSNNHANANNLVVGNGTAGGIANYVGTGLGWYAFSRDNANNTDAFDGGISYDGSRNLMFHANAGAERMRIDASGRVGIGTIPETWNTSFIPMQIGNSGYIYGRSAQTAMEIGNNAYFGGSGWTYTTTNTAQRYIQDSTDNAHKWFNAASGTADTSLSWSERMRIDSSGNLLVGTTGVPNGTSVYGAGFINTGASGLVQWASGVSTTTGVSVARFYNPNGNVGSIQLSGSATSYVTSSDQRLKENIADADDAGSKVDAIQVRKFDWIADGSHQKYGMIAQELMTVAPEAVSGDPESDEMMGVDYSKLVPMLIKEIQSLRARVAQLETN